MLLVRRQEFFTALVPPYLLLAFFASIGLLLQVFLPGWILMWILAFIIFATFKILSLLYVKEEYDWRRLAPYFLAWPDMNAKSYLHPTSSKNRIASLDWQFVIAKTLLGATCAFVITRNIYPVSPLMAGWFGFSGVICFLHFGVFSLLAYAWQSAGIQANPIMNRPAAAKSVAEFWSRWNTAFRQIAHAFVFLPAANVLGTQSAMLLTFLFSGLLHDLMISFPAGGGYGLPTMYFLIQGAGVSLERSRIGKRILIRIPGRLFAAMVVVVPVPLLFHPPFIRQVIIPFLRAIGAL